MARPASVFVNDLSDDDRKWLAETWGSSPILVARCENAADSISFWDERINH